MKTLINTIVVFTAVFLMVAVSYDDSESYCVIFPQNGRDIFGVEQRTIIVFGENEISLIPQVNFEGDARDFGILVPVPAQPRLATVGANIFSEASFLTQPLVRRGSGGCGCDDDSQISGPIFFDGRLSGATTDETAAQGVTIIYEETVGMYQAVVLQATSGDDLTQWLVENGYHFDPEDAGILGKYVAKDWYFVAMKLDSNQVPSHIDQWWSATTTPARITFDYSGSSLSYPLKISAISTKDRAEVLVYTIGPDPMRFPGAAVEYANELDDREVNAIAEQYPTFSGFITAGSFITKLRRSFSKIEMSEDIEITPTDDRTEFREIRYVNNSGFGLVGILILALVLLFNRRKANLIK